MCYLIPASFIHNNSLKLISIGYHGIVPKPICHWFWFFFKFTEEAVFQVTAMVLSSAKLCKSDFASHKNKSFIKMLHRIGPSIESCDTPERIALKKTRYIVTFYTLFSML